MPEDISVVGFDDDIYAELCEPTLTTVAVNIEEIGKVVRNVYDALHGKNQTQAGRSI